MKINLNKDREVKCGDVLHSHASDLTYLVAKTHNLKFTVVNLQHNDIWGREFNTINEMIDALFTKDSKVELIPSDNIEISNIR